MQKRFLVAWAYLVELLLSVLLLTLFDLLGGVEPTGAWVGRQVSPLGNLLLTGIAVGAAVFAGFVAVLTTEFGQALRRAGKAKMYAMAFGWPLLLFAITIGILMLRSPSGWGLAYSQTVILFLIYCSVNFFTMVKNVIDFIGLWQDVERARKDGKRPKDP